MEPKYLGDGAYFSGSVNSPGFWITANHHDPNQATDKVFLEPHVLRNLMDVLDELRKGKNNE